jgi:3-oxoacyl-[acyl-carrier-protein] synthase III
MALPSPPPHIEWAVTRPPHCGRAWRRCPPAETTAIDPRIAAIAYHFPSDVYDNAALARDLPNYDPAKVAAKTGIERRYIAAAGECASDLGGAAAERLFAARPAWREAVEYLIFCSQAADYPLPSTSCLLQHRLGLDTRIGAIDINMGCSGFVMALGLADGLIRSGQARTVLIVTADTYSKYIDVDDGSVRSIFGDGAAATIVSTGETPADGASLGPFVHGTDGSGANKLIARSGSMRDWDSAPDGRPGFTTPAGSRHSGAALVMDGPAVFAFTLDCVPKAVASLLDKGGLRQDDVDLFVFHQANSTMLEALRRKLAIPRERFVVEMADGGNTVSSTIPIALARAEAAGRLRAGMRVALVGFGVGFSWSATLIRWRNAA